MSASGINSIVSQMQALRPQGLETLGTAGLSLKGSADSVQATGSSFSETVKKMLEATNSTQAGSGRLQAAFEAGDPSVDLAQVMVASTQAQVAFRGLVESRNRLIQSYQDVMNMPV